MRVLHVVSTGERRGAEIFASDLVASLDRMGILQHVAVLRTGAHPSVPYEVDKTALGPDDRTVRMLRVDPRRVRRLRRLISSMSPDVLQAHGGEALWYSTAACVGQKRPLIVYRKIGRIHQSATHGYRRVFNRRAARRASRVVIVAEALRREAEQTLGVPPHKIAWIPNGIDPQRLTPTSSRVMLRRTLGIPDAAPVVLSLTALTGEKDPIAHVRVARQALRRSRNAFFVLAGDGPMRREVRAAIGVDGVRKQMLLVGSRQDVADLISASDILLLASRTEGMPACIIEAGMLGIPVAAYDLAGIPEVVNHGTTGLLAPAGAERQLADDVADLLNDPTRSRALGAAARTWCRSQFEIDTVAAKYLALYRSLKDLR